MNEPTRKYIESLRQITPNLVEKLEVILPNDSRFGMGEWMRMLHHMWMPSYWNREEEFRWSCNNRWKIQLRPDGDRIAMMLSGGLDWVLLATLQYCVHRLFVSKAYPFADIIYCVGNDFHARFRDSPEEWHWIRVTRDNAEDRIMVDKNNVIVCASTGTRNYDKVLHVRSRMDIWIAVCRGDMTPKVAIPKEAPRELFKDLQMGCIEHPNFAGLVCRFGRCHVVYDNN